MFGITRLLGVLLIGAAFCFTNTPKANAGQLAKPVISVVQMQIVKTALVYSFMLRNLNASYSLGRVYWTVVIYLVAKNLQVFQTTGDVEVGQSQTVEVIPEEEFVPEEAGEYRIEVEANSEANITGKQTASATVQVSDVPSCTTEPILPRKILMFQSHKRITFTAPVGCCYEINPFINTGVWYSLSPSTKQTVSDGQSVSFEVTAKDPKPAASLVAFEWRECSKGTPKGVRYVVIDPYSTSIWDTTTYQPSGGAFIALFGDPVSSSTGKFVQQELPDIEFAANPLLHFKRTYDGGYAGAAFPNGMGPNWQHNFNHLLVADSAVAIVFVPEGVMFHFEKVGTNWESRTTNRRAHLQQVAGKWIFTDITNKLQCTFDSSGRVTLLDNGINPVTVTWTDGMLTRAADGFGHSIVFTTDSAGRITAISDGVRSVQYVYNSKGELTQCLNAVGESTYYSYTTEGAQLITRGYSPTTPAITNEYDSESRVVRQKNAAGAIWTYDWHQNTATLTDPDGVKEVHKVNAAMRVTEIGPQGQPVTVEYGANGMPSEARNATGGSIRYTYHQSGQPSTIQSETGTTTLEYTARNWNGAVVYDVTKITFADGSTRLYQYNGKGLCTRITDERGNQWSMTYDAASGSLLTISDPMNRKSSWSYDAKNHLSAITSASGQTTTIVTNENGDIIEATSPGNAKRSYKRDHLRRLTEYTDELGRKSVFSYNARDQLTSIQAANATSTTFGYDSDGQLESIGMPGGARIGITYTPAGRARQITDALLRSFTMDYDESGNLRSVTDRAGNTTQFTYNADGQVISIVSPAGYSTEYEYDSQNRLVGITTPGNIKTTYTYDKAHRLTRVSGRGRTTTFTYDGRGNRTSTHVSDDVQAQYTYDPSGLLSTVKDPEGGLWAWTYNAAGLCTSIKDPAGRETKYEYDNRDRVTRTVLPENAGSCTYSYDAAGNLTGITYSNGPTLRYTYDALGRIVGTNGDTCEYDEAGNMVMSNGLLMEYNANGWLTKLTFAPGKTVTYTYTASGSLESISDWNGGGQQYTHDNDGVLLSIRRGNTLRDIYDIGPDLRVTEIKSDEASIQIAYDDAGRIQSVVKNGHLEATPEVGEVNATYDGGSACVTTSPDAVGRATQVDGINITWNAASQATNFTGSLTGQVQYDGFNRITALVSPVQNTTIVWNSAFGDGLPAVMRSQRTFYFVPTPGGGIAYWIDSATGSAFYPHYDHIGNVVMVSNSAGVIQSRIAYSPYGEVLLTEGTGNLPMTFGGAAGVITYTTKLFVTPGRIYYAPGARFLTPDPVRSLHPQRINPYQYAYCDPINWTDWTGRAPQPRPRSVDEIMEESNRRLEEAMRKTQEKYDAELRKIREEAEQRTRAREEQEQRRRQQEEELERIAQEQQEELRRNQEAFDRAQAKVAALNKDNLNPVPPPSPLHSQPRPGTTGNTSSAGNTPGGNGNTPGGAGQPPPSGGTRTRPQPTTPNPGGRRPPTSTGSGPAGNNGSSNLPQPLGPNATGRGTYGQPVVNGTSVVWSWLNGFVEGLSPSNVWDYYFGK